MGGGQVKRNGRGKTSEVDPIQQIVENNRRMQQSSFHVFSEKGMKFQLKRFDWLSSPPLAYVSMRLFL
jgi:hypothetical protein